MIVAIEQNALLRGLGISNNDIHYFADLKHNMCNLEIVIEVFSDNNYVDITVYRAYPNNRFELFEYVIKEVKELVLNINGERMLIDYLDKTKKSNDYEKQIELDNNTLIDYCFYA